MPYYPQSPGFYPPLNSVTDAQLVDMPDGTVKGRALGAGLGDPTNLTAQQLAAIHGLGYPMVRHDCRFDYISTTTCRLSRYGGALITIDAQLRTIPAAGVDLAYVGTYNTNGLVYAYALMSGSVMQLYADANAPVTDPRDGNSVHPGNPALTFVGGFYGTTIFRQEASVIGVISGWNRRGRVAAIAASGVATGSTVAVFLTQAIVIATFGEDPITAQLAGFVTNSGGTTSNVTDVYSDGSPIGAVTLSHNAGVGYGNNCATGWTILTAPGVRSIAATGYVGANVGTWSSLNLWCSTRG
jgi:hypothetical protein